MKVGDLPAVLAIEEQAFPVPWSFQNFLHEVTQNPFACNRVVRSSQETVEAYANAWMVDGEVRINNLAVRAASRRQGHGEALLRHVLNLGRRVGCIRATLEVRPSNLAALCLYRKLGFSVVGRWKGYYSDTGEDALVMKVELGR